LFEKLAEKLKPEMLLDLLMKAIPPVQRRMIQVVPNLLVNAYDLSQQPLPEISIKELPDANTVAFLYKFPNKEAMHVFAESERASLELLEGVDGLVKEWKAAQAKKEGDKK
jgi:hypothetical protein